MTRTLHVTDPGYKEELYPVYEKHFLQEMKKFFENCKSKFRNDLTGGIGKLLGGLVIVKKMHHSNIRGYS